jgi:hypothetical protein
VTQPIHRLCGKTDFGSRPIHRVATFTIWSMAL